MSVHLAVIFNHNYPANIPVLERHYRDRFSSRQYISPFYRGSDRRVSSVVELGRYFSGHIAQAGMELLRADREFYLFVADDMVINPTIDEHNLPVRLHLDAGSSYIKSLCSCDKVRYAWPWAADAAVNFVKFSNSMDHRLEIPAPGVAIERFQRMGLQFPFPRPRRLRDLKYTLLVQPRQSPWTSLMSLILLGRRSTFPLLCGYSDFVVVPRSYIEEFVRYCGVFAALNIFAEVAIPTALALACSDILTELAVNEFFGDDDAARASGASMIGKELWGDDVGAFERRYQLSIEALLAEFPADWLYVHPVKFSRWASA